MGSVTNYTPTSLKLKTVLALIITASDHARHLNFAQTRRAKLAIEKEKVNWVFRRDFEFAKDT